MKKCLLIGAAAVLPACAFAQSNVTIYGRLAPSLNYQSFSSTATKPEQHVTTVSSDTSWWGFRGTEDLGSGNRAYFKIEGGFQLDTGTQSSPSSIFNRETYAGLASNTFGSIQLGSQFGPGIFDSARVDPFLRQDVGAQFQLLQGPRGYAIQYQNAVQYLSPTFYGFSGKALASAGEGAVTGPSYSGEFEYADTALFAAVMYDQSKAVASTVGLTGTPVRSQTYSFAASYKLSMVKLGAWYQVNHIDNLPDVRGYMVGATIPLGEVSDIRTSYSHRGQKGSNAGIAAIGYFYKLSKRTEVYTAVAHLNNTGTYAYGIWPASQDTATQGVTAPGRDVKAFQVGWVHVY